MSWLDGMFRGYNQINAAGVALVKRTILNFGSGLTAVDNPSTGATNVTLDGTVVRTTPDVVKTADYTLTSADGDVFVVPSAATRIKHSSTPIANEEHGVNDRDNLAGTWNITVDGNGHNVERPDGSLAATYVMTGLNVREYGVWRWNGTFWGLRA